MRWEKHGDIMQGLDSDGWVRAIIYMDRDGVYYRGIYPIGTNESMREDSMKAKRSLMRAIAAQLREWGYR